jgi:hypothetical protein
MTQEFVIILNNKFIEKKEPPELQNIYLLSHIGYV